MNVDDVLSQMDEHLSANDSEDGVSLEPLSLSFCRTQVECHHARTVEAWLLLNQPEAQRKALLLGRWDSFEGMVFSEWNFRRHTKRFENPRYLDYPLATGVES
jgi:hypothetical protein